MGLLGKVVAAVVVVGLLFWLYASENRIDAVPPPSPAAFAAAEVEHGARLAGAGNCGSCHTGDHGALAGGVAMATPFGTLYSTNITPDPTTGIGAWSLAAFDRAMRRGIAPDGRHYYPAFPWTHFTRMEDADIRALYAWAMTRPAVAHVPPANELAFPFNVRMLLAGWKLLFFDEGVHERDPERSGAWNRGAYLAAGPGHCSACHSGRNLLGAEADAWGGAVVNGWYAPPLDARNRSAVPWDEQALFAYLRTGVSTWHGVAMGDMATVVNDGLAALPDADIRALATYFADLGGADAVAAADAPPRPAAPVAARTAQAEPAGAHLYMAACAGCHHNGDTGGAREPPAARPELATNSAVTGADPTNLLRAILYGVGLREGIPTTLMPGFDNALSDRDIIALSAWLRAGYAGVEDTGGNWGDLAGALARVRASAGGHHRERRTP